MESFNKQLRKINEQLEAGILPDELNFNKPQTEATDYDMAKLKYNAFYRSYEFVESKFPKGYENITGFDKIIQSICDNMEEQNITPLSEITKRANLNNESEK